MEFEAHLTGVNRSVSVLERAGRPAGAVRLDRRFPVPVADLWEAVTHPVRLARWFLPVQGDLKPGGRYRLEGNAEGAITACERPFRLALTWEFGEDVSWVDVQLSRGAAGLSSLALTHTALHSAHWDQYGPGATGVGWELGLLGLTMHLETPGAARLDEAAFAASPSGKAFLLGSSTRWGEAAVTAGAAPEEARAAARRTAAFYTGDSALAS